MAGKPKGAICYSEVLQVFMTPADHRAFRQMAEQEYGGNLSVAGRSVLKQLLVEKGYKEAQENVA